MGTKWIAVWYILGFGALTIAWDIGARRAAGLTVLLPRRVPRDAVWLPLTFIVVPLAVYLASWTDWLATNTGYDRDYAQQHGFNVPVISAAVLAVRVPPAGDHLRHRPAHPAPVPVPALGLAADHQAGRLLLRVLLRAGRRAVALLPAKGYSGAEWSQEVLAIGTPAIWWGSILALLFCLGWWLLHRDWRAGAVLLGVLAGWGPWFPLVTRTKFYYYALEFEPFLILSIVLCLGLILGPATATRCAARSARSSSARTCCACC